MRSLALGAALALAALAPNFGCAGRPPITQLSFVTTDPNALEPRVLRRQVRGEACFSRDLITATITPPWRAPRADHGEAIADAIDRTPGANVLTNVSVGVTVTQYLLFVRICAVVHGDAGVLE